MDLEEFDGDDVVVRITATPVDPADGPMLADEVVAVLDRAASDGETEDGRAA